MNNFFSNVQNFFQSVTTNDRYASPTGNRASQNSYAKRTVSGGFGPAAPLTSDDTGTLYQSPMADGRNANYHPNNPYSSNPSSRNNSSTNLAHNSSSSSLNRLPYTPGMRSSQLGNDGNSGNIPLQDYADGLPPPPAPSISWKRIDRWMEANYPELADELPDEATAHDLNELEADLDCTLPLDVRDSFLIHDGQERGGRPCGLIFGLTLLDLESVAEEWTHWKNTAIRISGMARAHHANQRAAQANAQPGPSSAANPQAVRRGPPGSAPPSSKPHGKAAGNLSWLDHQESVPEGAIQRVYAHPGWIPLISDYLGNNIGVDLAPGPKGRWGQVIIFGREFDRKYVVAPSWAAFLMTFADDLENGDHLIVDETEVGELTFRASNGRLIPYFDVLRSRAERLERQNRKPGPNQGPNIRRPGSQTNLPAGARISPRNSSTPGSGNPVPGRNVSGNFRRPNQVPSLAKEGRLISPMASTTNLPSAGLTKTSPPPSSASTKKEEAVAEPKAAEKSLVHEAQDDDTKEPETSKSDSKTETVAEPKKEEAKEDAVTEQEDKPTTTKEDKEEESKPVAEDKKETEDEAEAKEDKTADASEIKISDEADSDDEVDLLKDDMAEVAL